MSKIVLKNVYKVYEGGVRAVSDFNLEIKDKEFIVFVGPSGCGKSTTLRMIAGLEEITSGDLYMNGVRANDIEPKDRNIAMVFQSYALYPHMTVFDNMAFGLKLKKVPAEEIKNRVNTAAEILGIEDLLTRKPKALSGGQRQRVALGRAIVREPNVFLLDEPLSNLDAKLRVQMRVEITKLQKRLQTTFIYVTHDQTEAMTMGHRIVVMKDGIMQQVDSPATLYEQPRNVFVATFLGSPQMNIFEVTIAKENDLLVAILKDGQKIQYSVNKSKQLVSDDYIGKNILFGIRPENIKLADKGVKATIDAIEHLGSETIVYCKVKGIEGHVIAKVPTNYELKQEQEIHLYFDMDKSHGFDKDTSEAILGVPGVNIIKASLVNNKIKIGNQKYDCEYITNRLLNSEKHDVCSLSIDVSKVTLEENKESLKVKALVDFKILGNDNVTYYSKINGLDDYFIFRSVDDRFNSGDEVDVYIPVDDVAVYNSKHLRISTKEVITENIARCHVSTSKGTTTIKLKGTTLKYPDLSVEDGEYLFKLKEFGSSIAYTKAFAKENKIDRNLTNNVLSVKAYDEDRISSNLICGYLYNPAFDNYLSVVLKDEIFDPNSKNKNMFSVYKMPVFKLNISENDFELIKLEEEK